MGENGVGFSVGTPEGVAVDGTTEGKSLGIFDVGIADEGTLLLGLVEGAADVGADVVGIVDGRLVSPSLVGVELGDALGNDEGTNELGTDEGFKVGTSVVGTTVVGVTDDGICELGITDGTTLGRFVTKGRLVG